MEHVEISNEAYLRLVNTRVGQDSIADKIFDLFHDDNMSTPNLPDGGISSDYLRELGVAVRNWIELPSTRSYGFKSQEEFLIALGAFWVGEFPYDEASTWRRAGIKTAVGRLHGEFPMIAIAQQSLDAHEVYVAPKNRVRMYLGERNWPSLVYLAARFAHQSNPELKLHMAVSEYADTKESIEDPEGLELVNKQSLANKNACAAVALVEPRFMHIPYVDNGVLHFSVRKMAPEEWGQSVPTQDLSRFKYLKLHPAEGQNFFTACLYQSHLPAKIAHQIVRRATI